ncbi:MAG: tRNA (adenosine(37)-N6)-dimethylallyltransferase MiaA [Gemmatimonadaceae bacterium]
MNGDSGGAEIAVICGPTAAGKSAIGLWLARLAPVTIISADSRQVYREFDIGTAKPSREDRASVPHVGIDVVDPAQRYSAAAGATAADGWIVDALGASRVPLVVGGTGLYLRALFEPLFHEPALDPARRAELQLTLASFSTVELQRWVREIDPARAHLGRTQLVRTIEVACLAGGRMSELHRAMARPPRWRARYLLVDPVAVLARRMVARIDEMLDHGWPDEVRRLMQTIPGDAPAWNATGYDTVRRLVRGELSLAAAREEILIATRQYAKRQRTWFRHQLPPDLVTRLDPAMGDWRDVAARWLGLSDSSATAIA